jgi:hypothetical protein
MVVEVVGPARQQEIVLGGDKVVVGKAPGNDLVIDGDPSVSRVHLLLQVVGAGWTVEDLGSRNGTYLNGERLVRTRVLRAGDELRVGSSRLLVRRIGGSVDASITAPGVLPPRLTDRERDCLVALCAPVLRGSVLTEPASVAAIAGALVVSESAVKKLLGRLYDKFDLHDEDRRRGKLAAEALARGAVSLNDADR